MVARKIAILAAVLIIACLLTIFYFFLSAHTVNLQAALPRISKTSSLYSEWFDQGYWSSLRSDWDSATLAEHIRAIADSLRSADALLAHFDMAKLDPDRTLTKELDALSEKHSGQALILEKEPMIDMLRNLGELGHEYAFTAWSCEKDACDHLAQSFEKLTVAMRERKVSQEEVLKDLVDKLTWYSLWLEHPGPYLLSLQKVPTWDDEYSTTVAKEVLNTAQQFSKLLISFLCSQSRVHRWICTYKTAIPLVGDSKQPPKDLNSDGLYEDVNGNGLLDFDDYVNLSANMGSSIVEQYARLFDYDRNGYLDNRDLDKLGEMIKSQS